MTTSYKDLPVRVLDKNLEPLDDSTCYYIWEDVLYKYDKESGLKMAAGDGKFTLAEGAPILKKSVTVEPYRGEDG